MSGTDPAISRVWRLPIYAFLEELWRGRKVLELRCGTGDSAAFMARYGATSVIGVDGDQDAIAHARRRHLLPNLEFRAESADAVEVEDGDFDCVVVPDALSLLRSRAVRKELRRVLRRDGVLIACGHSAEYHKSGGASFSLLESGLREAFAPVQMLGACPFSGLGLVAFAANEDSGEDVDLEVDSRLVPDGEPIEAYVAVCGPAKVPETLTVMQLPSVDAAALFDVRTTRRSGAADASGTLALGRDAEVEELRRRVRALEDEAAAATGPSQSERIADALAAHMNEARGMQERVRELEAWSAELEQSVNEQQTERDKLEAELEQSRHTVSELERSNRELRTRAATAEGRVRAVEISEQARVKAGAASGETFEKRAGQAARTGPAAESQELTRQLAAREAEIMLLTAGVEGLRSRCADAAAELRALLSRLSGDCASEVEAVVEKLERLGSA